MIPPFNELGYLPPGIHSATLDEIAERFGRESEIRRAELDSLRWLLDLAKKAGIDRLIVNGSFVTDTLEPNDVDCVLLTSQRFPHDSAAADDLVDGLPFMAIQLVEAKDFAILAEEFFATDRNLVPKGVVEVIL